MALNRFESLLDKLTSGNISNDEQKELLRLMVTTPIPVEVAPLRPYEDVDVRLMEERSKPTKPQEVRLVSSLSDSNNQ